jgi:hypothetical protein
MTSDFVVLTESLANPDGTYKFTVVGITRDKSLATQWQKDSPVFRDVWAVEELS